nr:LOW QUALITY PROTEIN: taste receptor type 2 member 125-like [Castor canadensis]
MGGVLLGIFIVILSVEFITGNVVNGFIALVNCMDWVKRRKMSSVDRILTALAISRISLLVSSYTYIIVTYSPRKMTAKIIKIANTAWVVTSHFSIWLSTGLSLFYFLKIANFSNSIFLYLKWRVKKVVSVTLLVSLVLLFLNTVMVITHTDVWIDGHKRNGTHFSKWWNSTHLCKFLLLINCTFTLIPFTVSLTAFLLLIFSLWRHLKRMQYGVKASSDASTMAHMTALRTGIAFLLLYTVFLLFLFIHAWSYDLLEKQLIIFLSLATGIAFPSGHSFVLILGNCKLRQASLSVLWWLKCRSKDVKPLVS